MKNEPLSTDEVVAETPDGPRVVHEYAHLKACILEDRAHTAVQGRVTVVRTSLVLPEGGNVVDKIRGGSIQWDESLMNTPCSHVDNDPRTYDRISLERKIVVDGQTQGTSSIIYSETTEMTADCRERLVVDKLERYTQRTAEGDITGERYVRVESPSGEILEHHHHRSRAPIGRQ